MAAVDIPVAGGHAADAHGDPDAQLPEGEARDQARGSSRSITSASASCT